MLLMIDNEHDHQPVSGMNKIKPKFQHFLISGDLG